MSLSTHVLNSATGAPAGGLRVVLEQQQVDGWRVIAEGRTGDDGRISELADQTPDGTYRVHFDVAGYSGPDAFYPEVIVTFRVAGPPRHRHIPLLLGPYSYTTYLGS
jgi:5-hydroxyisourate hydrolase